MDKKELLSILTDYADARGEIKDLHRRIEEGKQRLDQLNETVVTDSVTCGKKGRKPLRVVKVQGKPTMAIIRKQNALERNITLLEKLEADLLEKQNLAEEYIQQIEKSELRTIFRLYYIDDLNWTQVAHQMNEIYSKKKNGYTKDGCRCKHNRYLEI